MNLQPNAASAVYQPQLQAYASNPVSTPIQSSVGYGGNDNLVSGESSALQNSILQRLAPLEQQQTSSEQTQLANQGITPGSAAYQNAMLGVQQQQNDLSLGAVQTADQEQQQIYNQALQNAQFGNQAQAQGFSQGLQGAQLYNDAAQGIFQNAISEGDYQDQQQYTYPLQAAQGLMSLGQMQLPQFSSVPQVQVQAPSISGTDLSDLVNQNYQQQVQQVAAGNSATGSIIGSIASLALGAATGGAGLVAAPLLMGAADDAFSGPGTSGGW